MREQLLVTIIGAGLAGCECALQLARRGVHVRLVEQRPHGSAPAHKTDGLAELVCSNSFKATRADSAAGLLKAELDSMSCILLECAREVSVPAGGALAVDRDAFSQAVTRLIEDSPLIELVREEATSIPQGMVVIAAGPLCSPALFEALGQLIGAESLAFYDAAAPIVDAESINRNIVFSQSRYEDGEDEGDYLNCPLDKESYERFWTELVDARRVILKDFERRDLFQACQPVEEVARTGKDALRYGALKPVGLTDPATGKRPWAVVQLRKENRLGTAYNLVGFQTNLAFPEQERVFRMIPGLEEAHFYRYGVMHRNSFVDAPRTLDNTFKIPGTSVRLAGQITGTEGYVEAIASGLLAALNCYAELCGVKPVVLPSTGAFGSLVAWACNPETSPYQPQHVNFGLIEPPSGVKGKKERNAARSKRALEDLSAYIAERPEIFELEGAGSLGEGFQHENSGHDGSKEEISQHEG
ncbi:MAG: methylenetetrahydrofolate--tRNA-(uracil(54)-C(5))-methyltransferase (FADH(2)-oxidizing) TrmFO [Atopobiaceae bacterium]|nr:methylenetetrahydrofolate--tRNA-(uracil(54)-C(5))-methyltransferase (FADH(2)-oxidizing) TrmFO [Atopobiaceae bacterium]